VSLATNAQLLAQKYDEAVPPSLPYCLGLLKYDGD